MSALVVFVAACTLVFELHIVNCHDSFATTFELPDKEKFCFYQEFQGPKAMVFDFEVIRGGNNDVDVVVTSPNGLEIFKQQKSEANEFDFDASRGVYAFCFSNEFSSFTHKLIYFELRPEDHETLAVEAGKKKPTADTQMEHSMNKIHTYNTIMVNHQNDYRLREARGRHLGNTLNERVQWWSMCQSVVIVLVGFGQVVLLKALFSKTHPNTIAKVNMMASA